MSASSLVPQPQSQPGASYDASAASNNATVRASLYVGDLLHNVIEKDLLEHFSRCGNVRSVRVLRDVSTEESLGYAYVNFDTPEAAKKAIEELNGERIKGKPCRVMWQERDSAHRNDSEGKTFIKGLADNIDTRALQNVLSKSGEIYSCVVKTNDNGESLGYGFCHFLHPEGAKNAIDSVKDYASSLGENLSIVPYLPPDQRPNAERAYTNVYFKGFDRNAKEEDIRSLLSVYGEVNSWFLPTFEGNNEEGKYRGFGFANFASSDVALDVVSNHGKRTLVWINGKPLSEEESAKYIEEHKDDKEVPANVQQLNFVCLRAMKKEERRKLLEQQHRKEYVSVSEGRCLFVVGISPSTDEADLCEFFKKYGEIETVKRAGKDKPAVYIPRDKDHGNAVRGYAFVNFVSAEACDKAVTSSSVHIGGKTCRVLKALTKEALRAKKQNAVSQQVANPSFPSVGFYGAAPANLFFNSPVPMVYSQMYDQNRVPRSFPSAGGRFTNNMGMKNRMAHNRGTQNRRTGQNAKDRGQHRGNNMGQGSHVHQNKSQYKGPSQQAAREVSSSTEPQQVVQAPAQVPAAAPATAPAAAPAAAPVQPEPQEAQTLDDVKQALGEKIYEKVMDLYPQDEGRWGKLTGMLLESINPDELRQIIDNNDELNSKIREANKFYEEHVNQQ